MAMIKRLTRIVNRIKQKATTDEKVNTDKFYFGHI